LYEGEEKCEKVSVGKPKERERFEEQGING